MCPILGSHESREQHSHGDTRSFIELDRDNLIDFIEHIVEEGSVETHLQKLLQSRSIFIEVFQNRRLRPGFFYCINLLSSYQPRIQELRFFILEITEELLPILEEESIVLAEEYSSPEDRKIEDLLFFYKQLAERGSVVQKERGLTGLVRHMGAIEAGLHDEGYRDNNVRYLATILKSADSSQSYYIFRNIVRPVLEKGEQDPLFWIMVGITLLQEELKNVGESYIQKILQTYDFSPLESSTIANAWVRSAPIERIGSIIKMNLDTITEIERRLPGTSSFLYREFRIADFGRYPTDLLVKQREHFHDTKTPYAIILYPRDDWNGTFYGGLYALRDLLKDVHDEVRLRAVECESRTDVVRALIKFEKLYNSQGSGKRISLAIIGGHATKDTIYFGGEDAVHRLSVADLAGSTAKRSKRFFEDEATIILVACSTGGRGGIAEQYSRTTGLRILAPTIPSVSIIHFKVEKENSKFQFDVVYGGQRRAEFKAGESLYQG